MTMIEQKVIGICGWRSIDKTLPLNVSIVNTTDISRKMFPSRSSQFVDPFIQVLSQRGKIKYIFFSRRFGTFLKGIGVWQLPGASQNFGHFLDLLSSFDFLLIWHRLVCHVWGVSCVDWDLQRILHTTDDANTSMLDKMIKNVMAACWESNVEHVLDLRGSAFYYRCAMCVIYWLNSISEAIVPEPQIYQIVQPKAAEASRRSHRPVESFPTILIFPSKD